MGWPCGSLTGRLVGSLDNTKSYIFDPREVPLLIQDLFDRLCLKCHPISRADNHDSTEKE
ncbi:MAG: hypothetical protein A2156_03435 [Deltaproteobacteria bacterium RBG_16_48_10]|nr:MAG: hypothetical protein A2156_03435 [Deltaproteobacteria bacterium RBG_16_48_10]